MIERGIDVNDGSLYLALDTRNLGFYAQRPNPPDKDGEVTSLDVIEALLAHGADPNVPYTKGIPERTVAGQITVPPGATPLDRAAISSDFAAIEVLIRGGASPAVATEDGTTPLMILSGVTRRGFGPAPQFSGDEQRLAAIRLLVEHGADVNAVQSGSLNTAMHFAATRGAKDIMALLESLGASSDARNAAGKTPAELLPAS
jgi:ankyrin repeat protein